MNSKLLVTLFRAKTGPDMARINIANIKHGCKGVYVGRACCGYPASPLSNPFPTRTPYQRQEAIRRYRVYISERIAAGDPAIIAELDRLADLVRQGDVTLACWCSPLACHAEVIRDVIEKRMAEEFEGPWAAKPHVG